MKTKEDILLDADSVYFEGPVFGESAYKWEEVLKVMDEYAKQEAIQFAEWMDKEGYTQVSNKSWQSYNDMSDKNIKQLYSLYLKSKQQ